MIARHAGFTIVELMITVALIAVLSTLGVVISTLIVAFGFLVLTRLLGLAVPLPWCLVFGALISPTDPVAVIASMDVRAVSETSMRWRPA